MYLFLDYFFVIFHSALVLFVLLGWTWKRVRRWHLWLTSLMLLSWFGLGAFMGWGYCPLTDWHWRVKFALGQQNLPASYVKYYVDQLTGMDWNPTFVDTVTVSLGVLAFAASVWVNWRKKASSL